MVGKTSIKVKLNGVCYWLLSGDITKEGAIAPLHHCDESSNVLPAYALHDSYAHWFPGVGVMRYQRVVSKNLEVIK